jgi:hypothetical protein
VTSESAGCFFVPLLLLCTGNNSCFVFGSLGNFVLRVWQFVSLKRDSGHVTTKNLPAMMKKLRGLNEVVSVEEIAAFLSESYPDSDQEIEFESFLRVHASTRF